MGDKSLPPRGGTIGSPPVGEDVRGVEELGVGEAADGALPAVAEDRPPSINNERW